MRRPASVQAQVKQTSNTLLSPKRIKLPIVPASKKNLGLGFMPKKSSAEFREGATGVNNSTWSTSSFIGHGCKAARADAARVSTKMRTNHRRWRRASRSNLRYLDISARPSLAEQQPNSKREEEL